MRDNLPLQLTSFVGRNEEIAKLEQRTHRHRLLTLAGTGGLGKTRLALEIVCRRARHHSGGVSVDFGARRLVDLARLRARREPVTQTVAATLGIREEEDTDRPLAATLTLQARVAPLDAADGAVLFAEPYAVLRNPGRLMVQTGRHDRGLALHESIGILSLGLATRLVSSRDGSWTARQDGDRRGG